MQQTSPSPSKSQTGALSIANLRFAPPVLPLPLLSETLRQAYDIKGTLKRLAGERDQNLRVHTGSGTDYLLKVASPVEDAALIDFQMRALNYLAAHDDDLPVPRMIPTRAGAMTVPVDHAGETFTLRVLSFLPGKPLTETEPVTTDLARGIGHLVGRVNQAFAGFSHPAATQFMPWNTLNGLLESRQLSHDYLPPRLRASCVPAIHRLAASSLPAMRDMPQGVIHNDAHAGNVLIALDNPDHVCGLIDFGDLIAGPIVQDIATPLASLIEHGADPAPIAIAFLEGFVRARPLPLDQLPYLHDAILARMILSVELLNFRVLHDLSDAQAIAQTDLPRSITTLERELDADPHDFTRRVMDAVDQME